MDVKFIGSYGAEIIEVTCGEGICINCNQNTSLFYRKDLGEYESAKWCKGCCEKLIGKMVVDFNGC